MLNLIRSFYLTLTVPFAVILQPFAVSAQHLFTQKLDNCKTDAFCLDCGSPKATYDSVSFNQIADKINSNYNLKGASGAVMFQVLVDSQGRGCTLSYSDPTKSKISQDIIDGLNACKWFPAMENGKPTTASINVMFRLANDRISGTIERVNQEEITANMSSRGEVKIYNTSYKYTNKNLPAYQFNVWQKENSALPQDMSQHVMVRNDDDIWYATLDGLTRFEHGVFKTFDKTNSPFTPNQTINAVAMDKANNIWIGAADAIFKFDGKTFEKLNTANVGIGGVYDIVPTAANEMLLCDDKGLVIYKEGKYEKIDKRAVSVMPSNRVNYAYRDKQSRLWIGTFSGSIMIDDQKKVTALNQSKTPLKGICITGAAEDEEGNIYFSLYDYAPSKNRDRTSEGVAKLDKNGNWTHYNDHNSGLPSNHLNSIFYDPFEKVLWMGTNESGLVRFDRANDWQVYHSENSKVPSTGIYQIAQDFKGKLYISTYNGMLRISKR
ncbi:two-component regulator propeller domain-containing protein [Mucilaginibacter sp. CSA2-8R]|uniref:two-component regulator propeller domain-containing protein n=1 Tax=Mucilaginibacter sp. CSA2-8R TaxID=3141542 RepID=UPI00315DDC7F